MFTDEAQRRNYNMDMYNKRSFMLLLKTIAYAFPIHAIMKREVITQAPN